MKPLISLTSLSFFERLTESEQDAILASTSPEIKRFAYKLSLATLVQSSDPRVPQGRDALIGFGILTQERANEVFNFF